MSQAMAESNSTQQTLITKERLNIANQACWEIEQLTKLLRHGSAKGLVDELAIRGVCVRIEDLSEILSIAINDDLDEVGKLASRLGIKSEVCHG